MDLNVIVMSNLYQQAILRHYHTPSNKGLLPKFDEKFEGKNPFCGDEVTITLKLDAKKKIKEVGWEGQGCVISQAATSIFSEWIEGKNLAQIQKITSQQFLKHLDIELSPTRMKCALLALETMKVGKKE